MMENSSISPDEGGRFGPRTLSDVSIASNSHSGVVAHKHMREAKVKFMCSYGGRILPRPSDKKLRYVGGETRVISVPRRIHYVDLLIKMAEIYGPDIALRYQLPEEDLDALVSVSSDEDLENMMDECDRLNAIEGSSRLRVFVFSSLDLDALGFSDISDPRVSEQHYVDAVNAVQREISVKKADDAGYAVGMFQSQALPFDRNLQPGSFPLLGQELKNESGFMASPVHETAKLWKELASNQHPGIENLVDLESGGSASSSVSSQHDVYLKYSNNQRRFPISQDQSFLESMPYGNDADRIYMHGQTQIGEKMKIRPMQATSHYDVRLQGSLDLEEQLYVQEVPNNPMEDMHRQPIPLSPGARLQMQLEVDQVKAVEPPLNGDQLYNPATTFVQEQLFTGVNSIRHDPSHITLTETGDLFLQQGPCISSKVEGKVQLKEEALQPSQTKLLLQSSFLLDEESTDASNYSFQPFPAEVHIGVKNEIDVSCKNVLHEFEYGQKRSLTDVPSLPVSANILPDKAFHDGAVGDKQQVSGGLSLLDELVRLEGVVTDTIPESNKDISSADLLISSDSPSVQVINHLSTETPKIGIDAIISMPSLLDTSQFDDASPTKEFDITVGVAELSIDRNTTQDIFGLSYDMKSSNKQVMHEDSDTLTVVEDFIVTQIPYEDENNRNIKGAGASEAPSLSWTLPESDLSLELEKDATNEEQRSEIEIETFMTANDVPVNAAAAAEAEAIARGLQTIHNCDLEELRELGSGTFGTVYHGKWRGTDVAIKRIKSSCFTGRPAERERLIADFWQEACILGQLHHPNVVAFYGVVPDGPNETLATVTEYMVNGSLKQSLLKRDRSLDLLKRLQIAKDAAFGMEYLHGKNVVHFDLKCENLLVNLRDIHRPICKVGDLGLSKVKQQTMISGGVRGTLPWMAPELLNGSSSLVSEKVDVFSFGIVLWELLTGEEPYANMHYGAIIGGIVSNTLRPPIPKWCDPAWKSLMERCWSANPAERPTFSEIARNLREMERTYTAKKLQTPPLSG